MLTYFTKLLCTKQHEFGPSQIVGTLGNCLLLKPKQKYTSLSTYNKNNPSLPTHNKPLTYNKPYYQSKAINNITEDDISYSIEINGDIMDADINVLCQDPKQVDTQCMICIATNKRS